MRTTTIGFIVGGILAGLAIAPAEAGCTRRIVNKSALKALVSRDGGPWVAVRPHRSQSIRLNHPGEIEVALVCGRGGPESAVARVSLGYSAIIDRCYYEIGNGLFEEQLGPGFSIGTEDTAPLTVNVPRQGDMVIGPRLEAACPAEFRARVHSRY